ncbi:MAG: aminopeptidase P N-terminal domain-containing protein [Bacteroidales bacterium]
MHTLPLRGASVLIVILLSLNGCRIPGGRSWVVPVTIDPSDLSITPEQQERFKARRDKVTLQMEAGVVILRSGIYSDLNRHQYRPGNYFYYLTGYDAPRSIMVLVGKTGQFILSTPPESIRTMIYEGSPMPPEEIEVLIGPDRLLTYMEMRVMLDTLLKGNHPIYTDLSDREMAEQLEQMREGPDPAPLLGIGSLVDELRIFKDPMEVQRLQKACNITARALINVMKACEPDHYEFEMESIIEGTFLEYGAAMPGFSSIVGSGPNSTILHYEHNDRMMEDSDLLLMDIGAEYGYYTADITRTIPVNGRFTVEQRNIYSLVLEAQEQAIEAMKPGAFLGEAHRVASQVITRGLYGLGLLTDTTSMWQQQFYILYPSSHYLGLDVHDVGDYGGFFAGFRSAAPADTAYGRLLEPGMVLTIEPGLYFREEGLAQLHDIFGSRVDSLELEQFIETVSPVYETYKNIGVRIEDDILITSEGNINLSRYAPKEIQDIQQLMR